MKTFLILLAAGWLSATGFAQDKPAFTRSEDVVYGRKFGTALTLDVFQPRQPNGCGVIMIISGGFFSSHEAINPKLARIYLDRGYTVFAVVHGSQPRFTIPEIIQDVHRAVRFIHQNAARWQVNPDKLGVTGGSAGGHLSLILATQGGPGKSDARDPVDRRSSSVAAVACFFPPTEFANWGSPGEDGVGFGRTAAFKPAFGARSDTPQGRRELSREISPIHFVRSNQPPVLIIHGDADKLVPLYQAEIFQKKSRAAGAVCEVVVRPGKDHGWPGIEKDQEIFADWFDRQLRGIEPRRKP